MNLKPYIDEAKNKNDQLIPCPICGGRPKICVDTVNAGMDGNYVAAQVICEKCGIKTGHIAIDGFYGSKNNIDSIIKRWNNLKKN